MEKSVSFNIRLPKQWVEIIKAKAYELSAYGMDVTPSRLVRDILHGYMIENHWVDEIVENAGGLAHTHKTCCDCNARKS